MILKPVIPVLVQLKYAVWFFDIQLCNILCVYMHRLKILFMFDPCVQMKGQKCIGFTSKYFYLKQQTFHKESRYNMSAETETKDLLHKKCPCRKQEIDNLLAVMGKSEDCCYKSVFVYGNTACGKTHVMINTLTLMKVWQLSSFI